MNRAGQFLGQYPVDAALAGNPALALERGGDDPDAEMALAAGPRPGMAGMTVRFIDNIEADRVQRLGEFGAQPLDDARRFGGTHWPKLKTRGHIVNCDAAMAVLRLPPLVSALSAQHTIGMARFLRSKLHDPVIDAPPMTRPCEHPGCAAAGEYRAPRSRALTDYYWFCLEHVRAYNASWNYYAGMNETEIESEIRKDMVGQRPTWRFGSRVAWRFRPGDQEFGLFDFDTEQVAPKHFNKPKTPQEKALAAFDLGLPLTLAALKSRYKELVKRHHPDANGGDKAAEERLKIINQAYSTLKASYFPS